MVLPPVEPHLHFTDGKLQNSLPCWRTSTKLPPLEMLLEQLQWRNPHKSILWALLVPHHLEAIYTFFTPMVQF
jgi:hypothetical protein